MALLWKFYIAKFQNDDVSGAVKHAFDDNQTTSVDKKKKTKFIRIYQS